MVISDNNTMVVGHAVNKLGIDDYVDTIKANPAEVDEEGRLTVGPYQMQVR